MRFATSVPWLGLCLCALLLIQVQTAEGIAAARPVDAPLILLRPSSGHPITVVGRGSLRVVRSCTPGGRCRVARLTRRARDPGAELVTMLEEVRATDTVSIRGRPGAYTAAVGPPPAPRIVPTGLLSTLSRPEVRWATGLVLLLLMAGQTGRRRAAQDLSRRLSGMRPCVVEDDVVHFTDGRWPNRGRMDWPRDVQGPCSGTPVAAAPSGYRDSGAGPCLVVAGGLDELRSTAAHDIRAATTFLWVASGMVVVFAAAHLSIAGWFAH